MKLSDILMVLAVLCSPFLAVFVQHKNDLIRENGSHRLWGNSDKFRGHITYFNNISILFAKRVVYFLKNE